MAALVAGRSGAGLLLLAGLMQLGLAPASTPLPPTAANEAPTILWSSTPTAPNQTVLLTGAFPNTEGCVLHCTSWPQPVPAGSVSATSVAFTWPHDIPVAAPDCTVGCTGGGGETSSSFVLNTPDPWWLQGSTDSGGYNQSTGRPSVTRGPEIVAPGGTIRVFGRNLAGASARLVPMGAADANVSLTLVPSLSSANTATFRVPSSVSASRTAWTVIIRNNFSGCPFVPVPDAVIVDTKDVFDYSKVFAVEDHGLGGALRAAAAAGGGVVLFGPGRFEMNGPVDLPHFTVLKGAGMDRTSLWWDDSNLTAGDHLIGTNLTYPQVG